MRPISILVIAILFFSCKQPNIKENTLLSSYFSYNDSIESGGVRMIPIQTTIGNF